MSRWVLVLLAIALIAGALVAFDIPLGGSGDEGAADGVSESDLLEAEDTDAAGTLKGRGAKAGEETADDANALAVAVPSDVRGTTKGGGVVRGRVVQKGGVPVSGATVLLNRPDSIFSYLRASPNGRFDRLTAQSGADGRFTFRDITPSKDYRVRVQHDMHATTSSKRLDLRGRETIDLGDLMLGPGGGLRGRVIDANGAPVTGARVVATWRIANPLSLILSDPDIAPEIERETTTDEEGRYAIQKLEPAPKTLFAVAPSGASEIVHSVTVEDGATKDVDDIKLPGGGFVAGTVKWADGKPIRGVRVFASPMRRMGATRPTETDAEGRFRIDHVPEDQRVGIGAYIPGLPVWIKQGIDVGTEDIAIEFAMPGSLTGSVVRAGSKDPVEHFYVQLDSEEKPKDWMLRIIQQQVQRGLGPTPFNDEGGGFAFPQVAAGTYTVRVTAPGFPEIRTPGVTIIAGQETELAIEIPEGNVARGRVRRANGAPADAARLYVFPTGALKKVKKENLGSLVDDREPVAAALADGTFDLPPQTPGTYDVLATHPDALPGKVLAVDLTAGDASGVDVTLHPAGGVRGLLLDEHRRPAKDEQVYVLYPDGFVVFVEVGDDGRFEKKQLRLGRCVVRWLSMKDEKAYAAIIGGKDAEKKREAYHDLRRDGGEHEITDGGMVEVTVTLPRRVRVRGRILMQGAVDPRSRQAWVQMDGARRWIRVEADDNGNFEKLLEPGRYSAWLRQSEEGWTQIQFEIPDIAEHRLDLDAPALDG